LYITPEHQELQEKYQKLVLRVYQRDQIVQAKDEAINQLKAQITPLKAINEEFTSLAHQLKEQITSLLDIIKEKDKQLQKLELIEHQYEQLKRLLSAEAVSGRWQPYQVNCHWVSMPK
jgi:transposase